MPQKPRADQTRESYMRACVKELTAEGRSGKKAREMCFAVWMANKRKGKK
jgi:hypothetical protein